MKKRSTTWFFEDPMDFEHKNYKLLANVEYAEKCLEEGKIHEAMDFIEDHLVCFYRFQTDQEIRTMDDKEIIGVDPIMMDLIYKKTKKDNRSDILILSDIAEKGILEFEALHSLFRIKWRAIEDAITTTYVPTKPGLISSGYVFLMCPSADWTRYYRFSNPEGIKEWKNFDLKLIKEVKYDREIVVDFIEKLKKNNSSEIFIVSSLSKEFDSKHAIDHVFQCRIYYKLQKDYLF
tara:strand:- start:765 stop:1466 length:702 start_codon:yes stop_codon:yes gene_type:complete